MKTIKLDEHSNIYIQDGVLSLRMENEVKGTYKLVSGMICLSAGMKRPVVGFIEKGTLWGPGTLKIYKDGIAKFIQEIA